jgi:hypothetical protein
MDNGRISQRELSGEGTARNMIFNTKTNTKQRAIQDLAIILWAKSVNKDKMIASM